MFNSVNLLGVQGFVSVTLPNFFLITIPGKFRRARISASNAFLNANRVHQLAFVLLSIFTVLLLYRLRVWMWKVCHQPSASSSLPLASPRSENLGTRAKASASVSPLPHSAQKPAALFPEPVPEAVPISPTSLGSVNPGSQGVGAPAGAPSIPPPAPEPAAPLLKVASTVAPTSPRSESLEPQADIVVKVPPLPPTAAKPALKGAASKSVPGSSSVSAIISPPTAVLSQESDSSGSSEDDEIADSRLNISSPAAASSVAVERRAHHKKSKLGRVKNFFVDGRSYEERRSDAFERLVRIALAMPDSEFYPEGIIRIPVSATDKKKWKKYLLRKKADESSKRLKAINFDMISSIIKDYIKEMALFAGEDLQLGQGQHIDEMKIKTLIGKLKDKQREHLKLFLGILCRVSEFSDKNKMTIKNIAISINDLLSPIPETVVEHQEVLEQGLKVVIFTEYLINHYKEVFSEAATSLS